MKIVIFGTGSFAETAYYYFNNDSGHRVEAFTVDKEYFGNNKKFDLPVIPFETIEEAYPPSRYGMFIAVAYTDMNRLREQKYDEAKRKGYNLVSYVNSNSVIWSDTEIGENCFILENQTIQPFVEIGDNVIIWSGNHIGHHSTIDDHCFVSSHVVISGHVEVGSYCFLGVNSTITDGTTIAPNCLLGAGALVIGETNAGEVYLGNKAKLHNRSSQEVM